MKPFLIAETPNAGSRGHRFLVPSDCEWNDARVASFIRHGRAEGERIGANYIIMSRGVTQKSSGRAGRVVLALVGVDTVKLSIEERDQTVQRLRDLLGEIDPVAARHPWAGEQRLVVPFPELAAWLERGFPPLGESSWEHGPLEFGEPTGRGWRAWLIGLILIGFTVFIAELVRWLIVR